MAARLAVLSQMVRLGLPKAMVITGPTATRKSDVAVEVAKEIGGEIISIDSYQVYKECNIGTSKPSAEVMAAVPHHLISSRSCAQPINVKEFCDEAIEIAKAVVERGNVPIFTGGTAFYVDWILGRRSAVGVIDRSEEEKWSRVIEEDGDWHISLHRLAAQDPERAAALIPNDKRRLARSLALLEKYGPPLSKLLGTRDPVFDFRAIAVSVNRKELPHIIDRRCERMVNQGLIQEVYDLMHRGLLGPDAVLRKAIGYGSSAEELEGGSGCLSQSDLVNILMRMGGASRQYSRRQLSWNRRGDFYFVNSGSRIEDAADRAIEYFNQTSVEDCEHLLQAPYHVAVRKELLQGNQKESRMFKSKFGIFSSDRANEMLLRINHDLAELRKRHGSTHKELRERMARQ